MRACKTRQLLELRRGPSGVIGAPHWLRERMRKLRAMPPPTLEEVRIQFAASAHTRRDPELEARIKRAEIIR